MNRPTFARHCWQDEPPPRSYKESPKGSPADLRCQGQLLLVRAWMAYHRCKYSEALVLLERVQSLFHLAAILDAVTARVWLAVLARTRPHYTVERARSAV